MELGLARYGLERLWFFMRFRVFPCSYYTTDRAIRLILSVFLVSCRRHYLYSIDFMHVYKEDLVKYMDDIIWLPEDLQNCYNVDGFNSVTYWKK